MRQLGCTSRKQTQSVLRARAAEISKGLREARASPGSMKGKERAQRPAGRAAR